MGNYDSIQLDGWGISVYVGDDALPLAARKLVSRIRRSIQLNGVCRMVFPGGNTSPLFFDHLITEAIPWDLLHLYPSDERCVPQGHIDRNDRWVEQCVAAHVPFPIENLHRIPAERGPEQAAEWFTRLLLETPPFDIVIMGMGEDGHTASLFPDHPALDDLRAAVPVRGAPKPPADRVSIGWRALLKASYRWIVARGARKLSVITRIRNGDRLPVLLVKPDYIFIDPAQS